MNKNLRYLCEELFGVKRFEIFEILCNKMDINGFVFIKIEDLMKELNISKPTIINTFKFLERKKLFKRMKNGLYRLNLKNKNDN